MNVRLAALAAALIACTTSAWAATSNVDVYGKLSMEVNLLPTHEVFTSAFDSGSVVFDPAYVPQVASTSVSGDIASIAGNSYTASANTSLGSNHVYAQADVFTAPAYAAGSFSGWYDQVTITGGSGTGTVTFTMQLNGTFDVGAQAGGLGYALGTSSVHPSQLVSDASQPWGMSPNPIASYSLLASSYDDPSYLLGLLAEPVDTVLTPGTAQSISTTLYGTFNFTYGESFYLIGGMAASLFDVSALQSFCSIETGDCVPPADGSGATTLDFSNSANLINIALPEGASASFASGTAYNVTAVPEPGEWLMLLAGLGLVGWRTRRKAS
jgi:hypothetical protein